MMRLKKLLFNRLFFHFALFFFLPLSSLFSIDFFWEEPVRFTNRPGNFPVSASSENVTEESFSVLAWQESIPYKSQGATGGLINIYLAVKLPGEEWKEIGMIAGPYEYSGTEPSIISL